MAGGCCNCSQAVVPAPALLPACCSYLDHIAELPGLLDIPAEIPKQPMIFLKSPGTITRNAGTIVLPSQLSKDVHHEVELAVQLGPDLKPTVGAVAIDLTARDVQVRARMGLQHTAGDNTGGGGGGGGDSSGGGGGLL